MEKLTENQHLSVNYKSQLRSSKSFEQGKSNIQIKNDSSNLKGSSSTGNLGSTFNSISSKSNTNQKMNLIGVFNSELGKTGFLSEEKMKSKRILQNPKRYLETFSIHGGINGNKQFAKTNLEQVEEFIESLNTKNWEIDRKVIRTKDRVESTKFRTFLMAMNTTSGIELDSKSLAFLQNYNEDENSEKSEQFLEISTKKKITNDVKTMEKIVNEYLEKIHKFNTEDIEIWIGEFLGMDQLELPYGLPEKVPKDIPSGPGEFGDSKDIKKFIELAQDNFLLLDGEYHSKIEALTEILAENFKAIQENWTIKESSILFYILNSFEKNNAISSSFIVPLQFELFKRLFPNKSKIGINRQKFGLKSKKTLEEKRLGIIRNWMKDKNELESKTIVSWKEITKKRLAEMEKKISLKNQKDICKFWAERLEILKNEKCKNIRNIKLIIEPIEKIQENKSKTEATIEKLRKETIKKKAQKFQVEKYEKNLKMELNIKIQQEQNELIRKKQNIFNKKRVNYRQNQRELKEKEKIELMVKNEEEKLHRHLILESIKEPIEIDYDPANILVDTNATEIRRFETLKSKFGMNHEKMAKIFRECYSFKSEIIQKDRLFRLEEKLKNAGLFDTSYGKQVLLAMEPTQKPHLKSQIKFED